MDYAIRYVPEHVCIDRGKVGQKVYSNYSEGREAKGVVLRSPGGVEKRFESAGDAADYLEVSEYTMYRALKEDRRLRKGFRAEYL